MNRKHYFASFLCSSVLAIAGCDDPIASIGRHNSSKDDDPTGGAAAALQCTEAPQGRSYVLFDNTKLETARLNENVGVNRARVKPFSVLEGEYKRVLGVAPAAIKEAANNFSTPPERWYRENTYSAVSLNSVAELSFYACLEYTKKGAAFSTPPTAETARTECESLMKKAWSRSPSPEEISACSDLALTGVADESDPKRRWAYACSSVLSASPFLTF